ncbi:hypothetical protein ACSBR1_004534 [Camellia fascicularis]
MRKIRRRGTLMRQKRNRKMDRDSQIGLNVTALDPSTVASEVWYGKVSGNYSMKMMGVSTVYRQLYPFEGFIIRQVVGWPPLRAHRIISMVNQTKLPRYRRISVHSREN